MNEAASAPWWDHFWLEGTTGVFDTNDVSYGSGTGNFLPPMEGGGEGKDRTPQVQGEGRSGLALIPCSKLESTEHRQPGVIKF